MCQTAARSPDGPPAWGSVWLSWTAQARGRYASALLGAIPCPDLGLQGADVPDSCPRWGRPVGRPLRAHSPRTHSRSCRSQESPYPREPASWLVSGEHRHGLLTGRDLAPRQPRPRQTTSKARKDTEGRSPSRRCERGSFGLQGARGWGPTRPPSGRLKLGCQEPEHSYRKSSICAGRCLRGPRQGGRGGPARSRSVLGGRWPCWRPCRRVFTQSPF